MGQKKLDTCRTKKQELHFHMKSYNPNVDSLSATLTLLSKPHEMRGFGNLLWCGFSSSPAPRFEGKSQRMCVEEQWFIVNHYSELVGLDVTWSPPQSFLVETAAPLSLSLSLGACFYVFVVPLPVMESICVSLFPNSYPEVLTAKLMLSGGRLWQGN